MTPEQRSKLLELLWDSLKLEQANPTLGFHIKDRVHTGWGTKTQDGLIACIESIVFNSTLNPAWKA